ncbi:MAG TPA: hypothetical protein VJO72_10240, partial [Candidatus Dormibacteraeota bacterium]|nr:hypothetical protein [Candidatus Dormibacteraeota bacterium]
MAKVHRRRNWGRGGAIGEQLVHDRGEVTRNEDPARQHGHIAVIGLRGGRPVPQLERDEAGQLAVALAIDWSVKDQIHERRHLGRLHNPTEDGPSVSRAGHGDRAHLAPDVEQVPSGLGSRVVAQLVQDQLAVVTCSQPECRGIASDRVDRRAAGHVGGVTVLGLVVRALPGTGQHGPNVELHCPQ